MEKPISSISDNKECVRCQIGLDQQQMSEPEKPADETLQQSDTLPLQGLQYIKAELLRTQRYIKDLQSEKRVLKKKVTHWTEAVQVLQESQQDSNSRLEGKIQALTKSSEVMSTELQHLKQNVQGPFQYLKLKQGFNEILHNSEAVNWGVQESTQFVKARGINRKDQREDDLKAQNRQTLMRMRHLCDSLKVAKGFKDRTIMGKRSCLSKTQPVGQCQSDEQLRGHYPSNDQSRTLKLRVGEPDACPSLLYHPHPETSPTKYEEVELQTLVEKLKDTLSLQIQSGHPPGIKQEFIHAAEQVVKTYTELINKTIQPTLQRSWY